MSPLVQGILYVFLQTCVLAYVLVLILSSKSYLSRNEPRMVVSLWSSPGAELPDTSVSTSQPFCICSQTPDHDICTQYGFELPDFGELRNLTCALIPHSQAVKVDTQQVFVSTAVKVRFCLRACRNNHMYMFTRHTLYAGYFSSSFGPTCGSKFIDFGTFSWSPDLVLSWVPNPTCKTSCTLCGKNVLP